MADATTAIVVPVGEMRHRVTVQRRATDQPDGGAGAVTRTWSDVATVWAKVETLEVAEVQQGGRVVTVASGRVTMRYLAGLTAKDRLAFGSRTLNIAGVIDVEERKTQHLVYFKEER